MGPQGGGRRGQRPRVTSEEAVKSTQLRAGNGRALARRLGRREHMSDTVQATAGLLSHQQTADLPTTRRK
nr:hypothetical protein [Streptomyces sp. AC602_WCS936]